MLAACTTTSRHATAWLACNSTGEDEASAARSARHAPRALLAPRRLREDRGQHLSLDRLFQDTDRRVARIDAFAAVARHEDEWNAAIEQAIGDRVDQLSGEIDVEDRRVGRMLVDRA